MLNAAFITKYNTMNIKFLDDAKAKGAGAPPGEAARAGGGGPKKVTLGFSFYSLVMVN